MDEYKVPRYCVAVLIGKKQYQVLTLTLYYL